MKLHAPDLSRNPAELDPNGAMACPEKKPACLPEATVPEHQFPFLQTLRAIWLGFAVCWILASSAFAQSNLPPGTPHPLMSFTESERLQLRANHLATPEVPMPDLVNGQFATSLSLLNRLTYVPVQRDQGACGNCWAWAGTGVMEIANQVQTGTRDRLSVQFINSCNSMRGCCGGGWLEDVAQFYAGTGFAVPWSNNHADWQSGDGTCIDAACINVATGNRYRISRAAVQRIKTVGVGGAQAVANIKAVLNQNRAVWFGFFMPDANWNRFFSYWEFQPETSIWNDFGCDGWSGHAVLCVGYDDSDPANPYWIMVNSWGTPGARPNGIFRVAMNLDYDCADVYWQTLDVVFSDGPKLVVNPFALNNGAASTTAPTVTLNNACTGGPTEYLASESSSFTGASWQPYSVAPTFNLSSGTGGKAVYFKVRNAIGESAVVSDAIQVTAPTTPEIEATFNGLPLTDGQTAAIDFGTVPSGDSGPTRTFTVRNAGTAPLALGAVTLPSGFALTKPLPSSLGAGAEDTFTVRLLANGTGKKAGRVSIPNNDSNENPFDFLISGTVGPAAAGIVVAWGLVPIEDGQVQPIDFGRSVKGLDSLSRVFTVKNTGGLPLTLGSPSLPGGYTLTEGLSSSLAPGQVDTFTVRLDTLSAGTKSGQITFAANVAGKNPFNFPITGVVLASLRLVYVDANSTCPTPDGSQTCPLLSMCDGYTAVTPGGTVRIHAGTYALCQSRLTKPMRMESYGGSVVLRPPGAQGDFTSGLLDHKPKFVTPLIQPDGSTLLHATVVPGTTYQVFTSTNLVNWSFVQEITAGGPELKLLWPDIGNEPLRLFKLAVP